VQRIADMSVPTTPTLLVVDDEEQIRMIAQIALRQAGFDVQEAATAEGAVVALRAHRHTALYVLDVSLPDRSSLEIVDELLLISPALKTLIVSGHATDSSLRERVHGYLEKPFLPSELIARIQALRAT
jgi:two-component system response regulator PrrA